MLLVLNGVSIRFVLHKEQHGEAISMSKKQCMLGVEGIPKIQEVIVEEIDGTATVTIGDQRIDLFYADNGKVCVTYLPEEVFEAMKRAGKFTLTLSYGYRMKCLFAKAGIHFLLIENMAIQAFMATPGHTFPVIYLNKIARDYFFPQ